MLERPRDDQPHYGEHLGDARYWGPYVEEVLRRHGLPSAPIAAPFVGTFPTFLVGGVVVKLFGEAFDGAASHAVESQVHVVLAEHPEIPAPALVAVGQLFDDPPRWPYLVTTRLPGRAIRDLSLSDADAGALAHRVGEATALLHRLPAPNAVQARDLLEELRANAPERLRGFGLPPRLVEQVPSFLGDALPASVFIHADLTADHLFVEGGQLAGLIDWGDALVADPYYELVAVYLDALSGSHDLLERYVDGYGWTRDDNFALRALQGVLEHQFNAISRVRDVVDLGQIKTLDELADRLFGA